MRTRVSSRTVYIKNPVFARHSTVSGLLPAPLPAQPKPAPPFTALLAHRAHGSPAQFEATGFCDTLRRSGLFNEVLTLNFAPRTFNPFEGKKVWTGCRLNGLTMRDQLYSHPRHYVVIAHAEGAASILDGQSSIAFIRKWVTANVFLAPRFTAPSCTAGIKPLRPESRELLRDLNRRRFRTDGPLLPSIPTLLVRTAECPSVDALVHAEQCTAPGCGDSLIGVHRDTTVHLLRGFLERLL